MVKKKINFQKLHKDLHNIIATGDDILFEYGSGELNEKLSAIVKKHKIDFAGGFDPGPVVALIPKNPNSGRDRERWNIVLTCLVKLLSPAAKDTSDSKEEESDSDEEEADSSLDQGTDTDTDTAPEPENDDEEESTQSGIMKRIEAEYSVKPQLDTYLVNVLPNIPIIGLPFKLIFLIFRGIKWTWELLLRGLDAVARMLNTEENLFFGLNFVSKKWKILGWIVVIIGTVLSYSNWMWFIIVWPVLRWLSDPFGRTFRFIKDRLGNKTQPEPEPEPEPPE